MCVCVYNGLGDAPQNCLSSWWDPGLHLKYDSMVPCESISQMASSTGSTNCIAHGWDQQTDRQTGHSTAITIGIAKQQKNEQGTKPALPIPSIYIHPLNGPLSRTTEVSRYQKGKTNLDFTGARDCEWQWHQLGHMQVCTSLQTDNDASAPPLCFYRPDALPAAQPTASKH